MSFQSSGDLNDIDFTDYTDIEAAISATSYGEVEAALDLAASSAGVDTSTDISDDDDDATPSLGADNIDFLAENYSDSGIQEQADIGNISQADANAVKAANPYGSDSVEDRIARQGLQATRRVEAARQATQRATPASAADIIAASGPVQDEQSRLLGSQGAGTGVTLQNVAFTQPRSGSMAVTVRNKQTKETYEVDQATADSMISMWPTGYEIVPAQEGPGPVPTPPPPASDREGQIANIEAVILTRAIRGEFTGAGMADSADDPLDAVRLALLEAGLSTDEAKTSLITLGNNPDWQRVFAAATTVPTAPPAPAAEVPGRVIVVNNETGDRQEVSQAAADSLVSMSPDIWEIVGPVSTLTPPPIPVGDEGLEPGVIDGIPYSDEDLAFFSDRWAKGNYKGDEEQLIADMVTKFNMPEISARTLFTMKRLEGLFLGDGKVPPAGEFAGAGVPTDEPESLFARFARARRVAPEAGETPAMARLRQEFDPVYRGFDLTRRLSPILGQAMTGQGMDEGYVPPTFQDYLVNRGATEQSGRMSSRKILAQLNALKQAGREEAGFRFGDVYTQGGDYIPLGPDAPMSRAEQAQLFEDAAAAQYGRRGGQFVGSQIAREREMFGAKRKVGEARSPNFFDYIRDKYRLNLGV